MVDRATVFGSEAAAYDESRPSYPAEVVDLIVDGDPALVVDVGCGTGIAARQVRDQDVDVLGVDPDEQMAAVARSHGLDVIVSAFEDWAPVPCDVLYAAQSWHWIDPDQGAHVAATALRPGGRWIAFWNLESDETITEICNDVYRAAAPELVTDRPIEYLEDERFARTIAAGLDETRCFGPMSIRRIEWVDRISGGRFVDRLDSHSSHRVLPDERRQQVRSALREAFDPDVELDISYTTEVYRAVRRVPD